MIREAVTAYGIWWGVTRALKWGFIFLWPGIIIHGCARLIGSNPDHWSEGLKTIFMFVTLGISIPVYLAYKRRMGTNVQG